MYQIEKPTHIVCGTVFYEVAEDFRKGKSYSIELVFFTSTGEELPLPPNVVIAFNRIFTYLVARETRTLTKQPALKIKTGAVYKPSALRHYAECVAALMSKIFGGMSINVLPAFQSVCE